MSVFTLRMHGRFQTYNFDLGQYDNLFWNLLHGHPLRDVAAGARQELDGPAEPRRPVGLLLHPVLRAEAGRHDAARPAVVRAGPGRDPDLSLRGPAAAARLRGADRARLPDVPADARHAVLRLPHAADGGDVRLFVIDFVDDAALLAVRARLRDRDHLPRGHLGRAGDPGRVPDAVRLSLAARPDHRVVATIYFVAPALRDHAQLRRLGIPGHLQGAVPAGRAQLRRRHRHAGQQPAVHARLAADVGQAPLRAADPAAARLPAAPPQLPGRVAGRGIDLHAADHAVRARPSTSASSTRRTSSRTSSRRWRWPSPPIGPRAPAWPAAARRSARWSPARRWRASSGARSRRAPWSTAASR